MADKQPMQADGGGERSGAPEPGGDKTASTGESNGGAYPNPHDGTKESGGDFDGGQSEKDYHGPGQLGDETVDEAARKKGRDDA